MVFKGFKARTKSFSITPKEVHLHPRDLLRGTNLVENLTSLVFSETHVEPTLRERELYIYISVDY